MLVNKSTHFEFWHFLEGPISEVVEITTEKAVIDSVENKKKENEQDNKGLTDNIQK